MKDAGKQPADKPREPKPDLGEKTVTRAPADKMARPGGGVPGGYKTK